MAEVIAFASALNAVDGSHHRHRNLPDFDRPRGAARVRLWLKADLQPPDFDFRFTPKSGLRPNPLKASKPDLACIGKLLVRYRCVLLLKGRDSSPDKLP